METQNNEQRQTLEVKRFTVDDVIPTKDLEQMSKKKLLKHIQELEEKALMLDHALTITVEQLKTKVRGIDGQLY